MSRKLPPVSTDPDVVYAPDPSPEPTQPPPAAMISRDDAERALAELRALADAHVEGLRAKLAGEQDAHDQALNQALDEAHAAIVRHDILAAKHDHLNAEHATLRTAHAALTIERDQLAAKVAEHEAQLAALTAPDAGATEPAASTSRKRT